jgi:hypothetical protein
MDLDGGLGVRILEKPNLTFNGQHRESRGSFESPFGAQTMETFPGNSRLQPQIEHFKYPKSKLQPSQNGAGIWFWHNEILSHTILRPILVKYMIYYNCIMYNVW